MRAILLPIGFLIFGLGCRAQEASLRAELEAVNKKITACYEGRNADALMAFYDTGATYLPEYKPTIVDAGELRHFFTDWFRSVSINGYEKTIYSVEPVGRYVLEIGNFRLRYGAAGAVEKVYAGKYMIVWKRESGRWMIFSEAFGAESAINPGDMPYADVTVKANPAAEENAVSPKLWRDLEPYDKGVVRDVIDGNGAGRAREFTEDGIYMPHFDPMQIGMKMLMPYMVRTYHPGVITYVRNTYRELFDLGDLVLLSGHFKVRWQNANGTGEFEGNMSNLMKRGKDGRLLMYRQIAHN